MYRDCDTTVNTWFSLVYPGGPGSSVGRTPALHVRGMGFNSPLGQGFFHIKILGWSLATSAVNEWFDHAWFQDFMYELALPILQTFDTTVRHVEGMVVFNIVYGTHCMRSLQFIFIGSLAFYRIILLSWHRYKHDSANWKWCIIIFFINLIPYSTTNASARLSW